MLDLGTLETARTPAGYPLMLDITKVVEDPGQPRQEYDEQALRELSEDIKERGVKSPVSVQPMNSQGFYVLNAGARRRRAAILAGLTTIPAFIDKDFTDFDQVNENEQRSNLSPMELAMFIQKRLKAGDKAADIARKLRRGESYIAQHKVLLELPEFLNDLYRSGRCCSAYNLYELKNLHDKHPVGVEDWCKSDIEITRKSIADLKTELSGDTTSSKADASADLPEKTDNAQIGYPGLERTSHSHQRTTQECDNKRIKKPVIIVRHGKKTATLLFDRRPEQENHMFIRYEGDKDDTVEVPCENIRLISLVDTK